MVRLICVLLLLYLGLIPTDDARAQAAEEFFKGKTLRFTVVYEPGGTYDLYSRLVIVHLPKHIPGNPAIIVQYMPGAGGMVGTVNLYEKAARDGTQLGMLPRAFPQCSPRRADRSSSCTPFCARTPFACAVCWLRIGRLPRCS